MSAPWRKLKDAENAMLAKRRAGKRESETDWKRLHDLFDRCRGADDAEEAICFHGVVALLAERNGDFKLALKHRMIKIGKIVWLQEEEKRNPTDGFQTQDYGSADLEYSRIVLREVEAKLKYVG